MTQLMHAGLGHQMQLLEDCFIQRTVCGGDAKAEQIHSMQHNFIKCFN